jgi:hypothetical protein
MKAVASSPARSGSSERYAKLRPQSRDRLRLGAGAEQDVDAEGEALVGDRAGHLGPGIALVAGSGTFAVVRSGVTIRTS